MNEDIGDIVKKIFQGLTSKSTEDQKNIESVCEQIFQRQKIGGVKFVGHKNKTLFVNVDSSARLYQVNLIKKRILDELKSEFPDIENISFRIGKV